MGAPFPNKCKLASKSQRGPAGRFGFLRSDRRDVGRKMVVIPLEDDTGG